MRVLKVLSYPGWILFALAAAYVVAREQANRELLSLLLVTAFATGELIVSASDAAAQVAFARIFPRLLNAAGAFILAGALFSSQRPLVLSVGSVVLTAGLILWSQQMRQDRLSRPTES